MPVYEEMIKDKDGKLIPKKIDGKKVYYVRTYVADENGNAKQITRHNKSWIGLAGQNEAQQEENRLKNKGINIYENDTLDKLAKYFLETKKRTIKESSYLKHKNNYDNYIKKHFVNKKYFSLTTLDIKKWKDNLDETPLSLNTKRGIFITISAILDYGCQFYGLERNVARITKNFKAVKGEKKKKMKFITNEQFEEAIKHEDNFIYYVALNLLFYTGIRRGEMLALNKFNDFDYEKNTIKIDETVNPKISNIPTSPKTDKSNRVIQILPFLSELLKKVIDEDESEDGYIFLNSIKLTTLKRKCDRMLKKIGLSENDLIRIHDLRHSFASFCINKNVEIQILSEYMGHENISITWDTYGHLYPNSQQKLLEKIAKQD